MLFNSACVSTPESVAKVNYFQCKRWSLTALRHKYLYTGLQNWCIMGYVQNVYAWDFHLSCIVFCNWVDLSHMSRILLPQSRCIEGFVQMVYWWAGNGLQNFCDKMNKCTDIRKYSSTSIFWYYIHVPNCEQFCMFSSLMQEIEIKLHY